MHFYHFGKKTGSQLQTNDLWTTIDSSLVLLNDGRITRIPDQKQVICRKFYVKDKATAIDLSLVSSDLAVNRSWETKNDPLGSDYLPIVIILNEKPDNLKGKMKKIIIIIKGRKYNYDRRDWQ